MAISVEKATPKDLETLYKIEKECFSSEAFPKEEIATLLSSLSSVSLMAKKQGEVVGFIIILIYARKGAKIGHIFTLDVAEKARMKGVGRRLLEEGERILRKKGVKACYLEVRLDNEAARRLYKKMGYGEIDLLKGFYRGKDGVRLNKVL